MDNTFEDEPTPENAHEAAEQFEAEGYDEALEETVEETTEEAEPEAEAEAEAEADAEADAEAEEPIERNLDEAVAQVAIEAAAEQAEGVEAEEVEAAEEAFAARSDESVEEPEPWPAEVAAVHEMAEEPLTDDLVEELAGEGVEDRPEVEAAEAAEEVVAEPEAEIETVVAAPFRGPGEWYVVHTYAGYENKVKANLTSRIHTMQMEEKIFDVHIPMEDVMEIKSGKKQVVQKKVFPGYLLVKMVYDNDSWYVVRNTPGVTGFVSSGTGSKPTPLSRREVEKILAVKKEEVKPAFRLGFEEGDVVRIISGPFADFNGTINEINVDQSKLKVLVNIFDRETPVELGFDQVAKV